MGYEIKLVVGKSGFSSEESAREDVAELDGDTAWFPYKKDAKGNLIKTGRTEIYFSVYGMIDLCKPGSNSELLKLDAKNHESGIVCWSLYLGDKEVKEDSYGDIFKPVPIAAVIKALEKDLEVSKDEYSDDNGYRRFRWALGFLNAMDDDAEVILYGY